MAGMPSKSDAPESAGAWARIRRPTLPHNPWVATIEGLAWGWPAREVCQFWYLVVMARWTDRGEAVSDPPEVWIGLKWVREKWNL